MHPLPEESARVTDLLAHKLDLDLLVHVDFLTVDETRHEDVVLLDVHVVRPVLPADPPVLEVVPEPVAFLLEGKF